MQTAQKRNVTEVYIGFTKYGALEEFRALDVTYIKKTRKNGLEYLKTGKSKPFFYIRNMD